MNRNDTKRRASDDDALLAICPRALTEKMTCLAMPEKVYVGKDIEGQSMAGVG